MDTTLDSLRTASPAAAAPRRWPGRVLSGLPAVAEASTRLGLPEHLGPTLGLVLLACLALYVVPRTAVLGAVLLTGYLGGAVLAHLRVGDPLISHTLFPIYIGALLWAGLYLRDDRVRRLVAAR